MVLHIYFEVIPYLERAGRLDTVRAIKRASATERPRQAPIKRIRKAVRRICRSRFIDCLCSCARFLPKVQ